jgi:uncharacterized integral membrane protein
LGYFDPDDFLVPAADLGYGTGIETSDPNPQTSGGPAEAAAPGAAGEPQAPGTSQAPGTPAERPAKRTRTSGTWTGVIAGAIILLLLLIFILENTQRVKISFLGIHGHLSLGVALLLAAVGGGLVVGIVGTARIVQLRTRARRMSRQLPA